MKDGQKIVFAGEGDQEPGIEPGDVIFVLDEQEDKVFKRQGSDLYIHMVRVDPVLCVWCACLSEHHMLPMGIVNGKSMWCVR